MNLLNDRQDRQSMFKDNTAQVGEGEIHGAGNSVAAHIANLLRGVGDVLKESGHLVAEVCQRQEVLNTIGPDIGSFIGLQGAGRFVCIGDDLRAERVVVATFDGPEGQHRAEIAWGDGTSLSPAEICHLNNGHLGIVGSHTYLTAGEYVITTTMKIADSAMVTLKSVGFVGCARARFAAKSFRRLLGRPIDPAEQNALLSAAEQSRESIVQTILKSRGYRALLVTREYARMLGRTPKADELEHGTQMVASGDTAPLRAAIIGTDEYFVKRARTNIAAFGEALYQDIFARRPQSFESVETNTRIANAISRSEFALQLLRTPEARGQIAQDVALSYASRKAYNHEVVSAANDSSKETWDKTVLRIFVLEAEYFPGDPANLSSEAVAEFAVQFVLPLPQDQVNALVQQLQTQFTQQFQAPPDVRFSLANSQTLVAGWRLSANDQSINQDRDSWMARTAQDESLLSGGEVGFFGSLAFLNDTAHSAFAASPKRFYSANGQPSNQGDVLFTGTAVSIDLTSNLIITDITGVKFVNLFLGITGSFGIRFTLHSKDTLTDIFPASDCAGTMFNVINVNTSSGLDVDQGDAATAGFFGLLQGFLLPTFAVAEFSSLFGGTNPVTNRGGVGAGFIANLPHTQLVPTTLFGGKIVFSYSGYDVEASGIVAQAVLQPATRVPGVQINGPDFIALYKWGGPSEPTPQRQYSAALCDLRGDANGSIPIQWQALESSTVINSPQGATTLVRFVPKINTVGAKETRGLRVKVGPDQDGFTAEQTIHVTIQMFGSYPQPPSYHPHFLRPLE